MGNDNETYFMNDKSKLIDLAYVGTLAQLAHSLKKVDGHEAVFLVPEGIKMLTPPRIDEIPLPDHIRQNVELNDLASFVAYVKKFQTATAAIFANTNDTGADFQSVLNYHEGGRDGKAMRSTHIAKYQPKYSPEFQAWKAIDGKKLSQEQFLEHLRKNGADITGLDDADLIELASNLDFQVAGEYSSHVERTKGGRKLLFNEVVTGGAQVRGKAIDVPDKFAINVPIFVNGASYSIAAEILYRPQGVLTITIELKRPHLVVRQAVKDIVTEVTEGTGIQPFLGSRSLF